MKLERINVNYLQAATKLQGSVVAIGNFDGCHRGHQVLFNEVLQQAHCSKQRLATVALSFYPLPAQFFTRKPHKLMTVTEKTQFLHNLGLDYLYLLQFNHTLMQMTPAEFVQQILHEILAAKVIVVGADFCFGKDRSGDVQDLQRLAAEYNIKVQVVADKADAVGRVSSTRIRAALQAGNFAAVSSLLGRDYAIAGRVVHGEKLGRTLGFPTANIPLLRRVPPLHGIYVVQVWVRGQQYWGAASIGTRPAVGGKQLLLEVNIFAFDKTIYGERIRVIFKAKIRDEENFASLDALKQQIAADVQWAQDFAENYDEGTSTCG